MIQAFPVAGAELVVSSLICPLLYHWPVFRSGLLGELGSAQQEIQHEMRLIKMLCKQSLGY